ncbi:MAG: TonB-dependent receptor [Flavobacteriales bacterium MED-G15]|nr:MAG: TonB-dependent receptor [Flavobacteriales bacterium MED-G15]
MIQRVIFSLLLLSSQCLYSQNGEIKVRGYVSDSLSQSAIAYASILIRDKNSLELINGTSSDENGFFELETFSEEVIFEVSLIGYQDYIIKEFEFLNNEVDLGEIRLTPQTDMLKEVELVGEKSTTEFRLDKRVFNVGKDLSSTGASALEVLDNVPSVTVSIEGQISLRGNSGVQILINGKPSVLASDSGNALGTITADMIEKVEVITNPSAKYEAEGTAGIINIVIKKEERKGLNGSFSLNYGSPLNNSGGLSLNKRTERFNLFTQLGSGYRKLPTIFNNKNLNLLTQEGVHTQGREYRNEVFYNIILGTDYYINPQNVITLSGFYAFEDEEQPSNTNVKIFENQNDLVAEWDREEKTEAGNPKYQYELIYKKDFLNDEDHDLILSATGNLFSKRQSSEFSNKTVLGSATFKDQQTRTYFREAVHIFKVDYTNPFSEKWTLEAGAQYGDNDVSNDFEVKNDSNGSWVVDPGLTNTFSFSQRVLGIYGTTSYESNLWGLKLGLRMESTAIETNLVNSNQKNNQNFEDLFPTLHSSFKLNTSLSLQAGYSRRIYRPRLWELNPFFNIRNSFNIRQGNPDLGSEYSDSYEVSAIYNIPGLSLNFSLFQLFTSNVIEYISRLNDNISVRKPENLGTKKANGIEMNGKLDLTNKIVINGDFNFNAFDRKAYWNEQSFDFKGERWSTRISSKIKLPKEIDVEFAFDYRSNYKTIDGQVSPSRNINFGIRKKVLNKKGVINLSVRDIFATRIQESRALRNNFNIINRSYAGTFFRLGFSYGFGKGDAMEFRGGRRR